MAFLASPLSLYDDSPVLEKFRDFLNPFICLPMPSKVTISQNYSHNPSLKIKEAKQHQVITTCGARVGLNCVKPRVDFHRVDFFVSVVGGHLTR